MLLSSCHATFPQDVSAATALAAPDDDLGDDYARRTRTHRRGEADAFHTPSPIGGDLG